ncbi:MAG TPA: PilN domain-containing protein [Stellaceae bacterium]|nr:PilN domain-containing protein [Stellaceae bacterium]
MTIAANNPLKSARPPARIGRALGWWLGELRGCGDDLRRWAVTRGRGTVTIEAGERYWLLRQGQRPIGQVDWQSADPAQVRNLIPPAQQRGVVVEIPPERALSKIVDFPAGAKGQLDRIVEFEIARHFPFPAKRVYFHHRLVPRGDGGGATIAVEIVAVPRDVVDGIGAVLAEAGLRPAGIAVLAGADSQPLFLPAAVLGARAAASPATRRLGFAAALAAVAAAVSWPLAQQAQLTRIEHELAVLKPRAEAALRAGEAQRHDSERSDAVLGLRAGRPPLVTVLDALSRDVPDGSYLLSLSVSGREVVMDGLSPSAATMALALEKGGNVAGVVFRTPITREPASGLEHFQLGATLAETKP